METTSEPKITKYNDRKPIRWLFKKLITLNLHLLTEFRVYGVENIPTSGGLLVVSNHFSFIDPVVLIQIMPRPIEFVGGSDLPNSPLILRWIPRVWGTYKVHRGASSRDALLLPRVLLKAVAHLVFSQKQEAGQKYYALLVQEQHY